LFSVSFSPDAGEQDGCTVSNPATVSGKLPDNGSHETLPAKVFLITEVTAFVVAKIGHWADTFGQRLLIDGNRCLILRNTSIFRKAFPTATIGMDKKPGKQEKLCSRDRGCESHVSWKRAFYTFADLAIASH
jgi:hypothetical protein